MIYDRTDSAVIEGTPAEVWEAFEDELTGRAEWWAPPLTVKRLDPNDGSPTIGTAFEVTIHGHPGTVHFSERITDLAEPSLARLEIFDGMLRGREEWRFEPTEGGTRVTFHIEFEPHGFMPWLIGHITNLGEGHSRVATVGFQALNEFVRRRGLPKTA